jgi:hypothetical protein
MCADQLTRRDFAKLTALGIGGTITSNQHISRWKRHAEAVSVPPSPNGEPTSRDNSGHMAAIRLRDPGRRNFDPGAVSQV